MLFTSNACIIHSLSLDECHPLLIIVCIFQYMYTQSRMPFSSELILVHITYIYALDKAHNMAQTCALCVYIHVYICVCTSI